MIETQNIEYKESWRDEYLKWICGFANAQGGTIYIGIDDNGNVIGLNDSKKLMEDIPNKIINKLGIVVDVNLYEKDNKEYICISVDSQPYPVSYNGEYHYRSGSTKQQLVGQQLNQFLIKKTGISWDSVPVVCSPDSLRMDSFDIFKELAVKNHRMNEADVNVDNKHLLDSLNLLDGDNLKRAGVLLFYHNPEKWIPGSTIKIGYFESDSEILYQDELRGSLLKQANEVIDLLYTKYFKGIISYDGIVRVENYPYPMEAIREAVLNAISHKNYATLVPIQIKVYSDHLTIANDCMFPEDWTVDNLLGMHKSRPYNPLIAGTLYRAGLIESWGRGIDKIINACKASGNNLPEFMVKPSEMSVAFKTKLKNPAIESKNPAIESLINQLSCKITTRQNIQTLFADVDTSVIFGRSDVQRICRVSYSLAGDIIAILKENEFVEAVKGYGKGKYRFQKLD